MRISSLALLVAFFCLSGCALISDPEDAYRNSYTSDDCTESSDNEACRSSILETTKDYRLHFIEFDDQGLQYPARGSCPQETELCEPHKAYQIENLFRLLEKGAAADPAKPMTIIVFVHGWKHNARYNDPNVEGFRRFLNTASQVEQGRQVIGVYASWRGRSINVAGLEEITFWDRKNTASNVAQGSSRELFARLRGFKTSHNAADPQQPGVGPERPQDCTAQAQRVKLILIGHSFGGLIVYNATSGSLIESLTHALNTRADDTYSRFSDLTVLLNPAFEATRYTPVHRIASTRVDRYEPPLLISVTSEADRATKNAFPAGRFFSTLFESYVNKEEEQADHRTMGHYGGYHTHRLEIDSQEPAAACTRWDQASLSEKLSLEQQARTQFLADHRDTGARHFRLKDSAWERKFCGGTVLRMIGTNANTPVWNVITTRQIIPNHNNIDGATFIDFFRQIYLDTITQERTTCDRNAAQ